MPQIHIYVDMIYYIKTTHLLSLQVLGAVGKLVGGREPHRMLVLDKRCLAVAVVGH